MWNWCFLESHAEATYARDTEHLQTNSRPPTDPFRHFSMLRPWPSSLWVVREVVTTQRAKVAAVSQVSGLLALACSFAQFAATIVFTSNKESSNALSLSWMLTSLLVSCARRGPCNQYHRLSAFSSCGFETSPQSQYGRLGSPARHDAAGSSRSVGFVATKGCEGQLLKPNNSALQHWISLWNFLDTAHPEL